jgi:paraquat-inducible protein B
MAIDTETLKKMIDSRLDDFHQHVTAQIEGLNETQLRIEREVTVRLDRIEKQTTAHNGRMSSLEITHIKDETLREERQKIAADELIRTRAALSRELDNKQDAHARWAGIGPALVAGSVSGILLIVFASMFPL